MKIMSFILLGLSLQALSSTELQSVSSVDLQQYVGKWYEISRYTNNFQKECAGTTAEYTNNGSYIEVKNSCQKKTDTHKVKVSNGYATIADKQSNSKLKVSFVPFFGRFGWFSGNYWIIELGDNYEYAVIGEPKRRFLWILSRTKTMSDSVYQEILNKLETLHHYDTSKLIKTPIWL
jgi:apolipoprotein D and lipocalin family protein